MDWDRCLELLCQGLADDRERVVCHAICRDDEQRKALAKLMERYEATGEDTASIG